MSHIIEANSNGLEELLKRREPLHADLAKCLYSGGPLGQMLKHPLVFAIPYIELMNATYNKQYEYKRQALEKAFAEKNWTSYLYLHERPYRFEAFRAIEPHVSDADYWHHLASIWSDSENLYQYQGELDYLLECERPGRENMMDAEEQDFLASLPDTFVVYRGHQRINKYGYSWTLSYWKARWFSERFARKGAAIATGVVRKQNVIATLLGRREFEIIVHPDNVEVNNFRPRKAPLYDSMRYLASSQFMLGGQSIHNPWHWDKVLHNALALAKVTKKVNRKVLQYFAVFHDCKRTNENEDPQHGPAAADYVRQLRANGTIHLTDDELEKLDFAIRHHDNGLTSNDPTIGVCWDADRLDLSRVGLVPDKALLSTQAAKEMVWNI